MSLVANYDSDDGTSSGSETEQAPPVTSLGKQRAGGLASMLPPPKRTRLDSSDDLDANKGAQRRKVQIVVSLPKQAALSDDEEESATAEASQGSSKAAGSGAISGLAAFLPAPKNRKAAGRGRGGLFGIGAGLGRSNVKRAALESGRAPRALGSGAANANDALGVATGEDVDLEDSSTVHATIVAATPSVSSTPVSSMVPHSLTKKARAPPAAAKSKAAKSKPAQEEDLGLLPVDTEDDIVDRHNAASFKSRTLTVHTAPLIDTASTPVYAESSTTGTTTAHTAESHAYEEHGYDYHYQQQQYGHANTLNASGAYSNESDSASNAQSVTLSDEAIAALTGRRKKRHDFAPVNIVDVRQSDQMSNWNSDKMTTMPAVGYGPSAPSRHHRVNKSYKNAQQRDSRIGARRQASMVFAEHTLSPSASFFFFRAYMYCYKSFIVATSMLVPPPFGRLLANWRHFRRHAAFTQRLLDYNQRTMTLPLARAGSRARSVQLQYAFDLCDEFPAPFLQGTPSFSKGAPDPAKIMARPVVLCLDGGYVEARWLASWLAWTWRRTHGDYPSVGAAYDQACCLTDQTRISKYAQQRDSPLVQKHASADASQSREASLSDHALAPFSLLAVSRPGYLRSTPLATLDAELEALTTFLTALGIHRPVHVMARGLSATAALALAARYPERVQSLTLVSAIVGPGLGRPLRSVAGELLSLGTDMLSNMRAFQLHRITAGVAATAAFTRQLVSDTQLRARLPLPDSALLREIAEEPESIRLFTYQEACFAWGRQRRNGLWRDYRLLQRMDASHFAKLMQSVHVPLLALHGEQDPRAHISRVADALALVDRQDGRTNPLSPSPPSSSTALPTDPLRLERRLVRFAGTGHMLPPGAVGRATLAFMQSHGNAL
ncbi:Alpha/Beta hydrolase protein [Thamnocephalis sphaerospora]|uniref:Alpha/Beta hydrolase protein n=1 Tax=Thamnocephalis sphaerospora TaxID=78915 RepID=A0A4P9XJ68_9FUNG|nr:Alpha/Beta hydrolase protein [Thamnocephalis sphaerospora]|eukprot:RKP05240.1 Alpha/Beta hydrolase protein [Thamnocephalis sphaerospora]